MKKVRVYKYLCYIYAKVKDQKKKVEKEPPHLLPFVTLFLFFKRAITATCTNSAPSAPMYSPFFLLSIVSYLFSGGRVANTILK